MEVLLGRLGEENIEGNAPLPHRPSPLSLLSAAAESEEIASLPMSRAALGEGAAFEKEKKRMNCGYVRHGWRQRAAERRRAGERGAPYRCSKA